MKTNNVEATATKEEVATAKFGVSTTNKAKRGKRNKKGYPKRRLHRKRIQKNSINL
jgi:hypothetical protein